MHSVCLQLLGASTPDLHRGSAPGPGAGPRWGSSVPQKFARGQNRGSGESPDPLFCPLANFWLRPCAVLFKSTCQHAHATVNWLSMSLSRHTCQIYVASSYFPASSSLILWFEKCHDRLPTVKTDSEVTTVWRYRNSIIIIIIIIIMSRLLIWFAYLFVDLLSLQINL